MPEYILFLCILDARNRVTYCQITSLWAAQVLFKDLPVALAAVDCNGTEDSITECQSNDRRVSACTNFTSSTVLACANSGEGELRPTHVDHAPAWGSLLLTQRTLSQSGGVKRCLGQQDLRLLARVAFKRPTIQNVSVQISHGTCVSVLGLYRIFYMRCVGRKHMLGRRSCLTSIESFPFRNELTLHSATLHSVPFSVSGKERRLSCAGAMASAVVAVHA